MPLPLMVRLDDDVAEKVREQSYVERIPMNRIINDALHQFYERDSSNPVTTEQGYHLAATFRERLQPALDAVQALPEQENDKDYKTKAHAAMTKMMDCITAIMVSIDPTLAPKISYEPKSQRKRAAKEKVEA
jgi:predicted transcriptional regulator